MRLSLAGDVMIGRLFNDIFQSYPDFNIWGNTKEHLLQSDFFAFNLETTITDSDHKWPDKTFNYKLSPTYAKCLKEIGVKCVSLANNHILDYQCKGLEDTLQKLDELGILHSGAGFNLKQCQKPAVYTLKDDRKIYMYSAADHYHFWAADQPFEEVKKNEGIWWIDVDGEDWNEALEIISQKRSEIDRDDIILFSIHYGPNWAPLPSTHIRDFAYELIEAGVDIIHGHSTHHVQKMEYFGNGVCFYGMGDFIDDYVLDVDFRSDLSFIADIYLNEKGSEKKIKKVEILPTKISKKWPFHVNFAEDEMDKEWVYKKVIPQKKR